MGKGLIAEAVCPRCGRPYRGYPALSRIDNRTEICPDCGVREALETLGISEREQDSILETIHNCSSNRT